MFVAEPFENKLFGNEFLFEIKFKKMEDKLRA